MTESDLQSKVLRSVLSGLILLVITSSALLADFEVSFKEGIRSLDQRHNEEAAEWFRRALAENDRASADRVSIYGMRFVSYLPYYYLGVALYKSGDLEGARQAWEISVRQGAIEGAPKESKELRKFQGKLPPLPEPDTQLQADRPARAESPPDAEALDPEPSSPDDSVLMDSRRIEQAQEGAEHPQFETSDRVAPESGTNDSDGSLDPAAATPPPSTTNPGQSSSTDPSSLVELLRASGAALLQDGEYAQVLRTLDGVEFFQPENQRKAHILLAAAAFYLDRLDGDSAYRQRAETEVRACIAIDPDYTPSERYFTPAFVAFYDEVRSEN